MRRNAWQIGVPLAVVLAAAGCTGTDFLSSGNNTVHLSVAADGVEQLLGDYECIMLRIERTRVRPLDGTCAPGTANEGEPCLDVSDCDGPCEGSEAQESIGTEGILTVDSQPRGNFLEGPCSADNPLVNNAVQGPEFENPPAFVLPDGLYEVSEFRVTDVIFFHDGVDFMDPEFEFRPCTGSVDITTQLGDLLRFRLESSDKTLHFTLHLDLLEAVFQPFVQNCSALRNNLQTVLDYEEIPPPAVPIP